MARSNLSKATSRTIGLQALRRNLRKFVFNVGNELGKIQDRTADIVLNDARSSLRLAASRPGSPPAMRTGELANSVVKVKSKKSTIHVGTGVKHGFFTEFGTVHQRPRPWLYPALKRAKPLFEREAKQLHVLAMQGINPNEKD